MDTKISPNYWWAILIRGIVAIVFAFMAFFWTGFTLELLIVLFGIYVLLDGILAMIAAVKAMAHHRKWWLLLLEGVVSLAIAIMVFVWPIETTIVLVYLIAIWAILTGILEFFVGVAAPWEAFGKAMAIIGGVLSIILGVIIIAMPLLSIVILIWLVGVYALIVGLALVILSFQLKAAA